MGRITLPEDFKLVEAIPITTTNLALVGDYISLKNAQHVTIVVSLKQAVAHATSITIEKATAVGGTGATAITADVQIWANEDTAATDTLVRKTDALSYTVTNDIKNKQVVFKVDTASLDGDYDCLVVKIAASSQATNFASAVYYLGDLRFSQATPPSAIID